MKKDSNKSKTSKQKDYECMLGWRMAIQCSKAKCTSWVYIRKTNWWSKCQFCGQLWLKSFQDHGVHLSKVGGGENHQGIPWTRIAQPYPQGLCKDLAFVLTSPTHYNPPHCWTIPVLGSCFGMISVARFCFAQFLSFRVWQPSIFVASAAWSSRPGRTVRRCPECSSTASSTKQLIC